MSKQKMRPMSTAPKDGSDVLVFVRWTDGFEGVTCCYKHPNRWLNTFKGRLLHEEILIGWTPLPEEPVPVAKEDGDEHG